MRVGRGTIDRWIRAYRSGGFEALAPVASHRVPVTEERLLELAEALKREVPRRTAAQVAQIVLHRRRRGPSERTLQRHLARLGLNTRPDGSAPRRPSVASRPPPRTICGPATPCTARPIAGARPTCSPSSTTTRGRSSAIGGGCRKTPSASKRRFARHWRRVVCLGGAYVDNGSAFVSKQLLRATAPASASSSSTVRPGKPEGRGKIERFFETVRVQFLVEIEAEPATGPGRS